MNYVIVVVSFVFCIVSAVFSTWMYIYAKRKENEGVDMGCHASATNFGPMALTYFCTIITFLMLIGVIKIK